MRQTVSLRLDVELVDRARRMLPQLEVAVYLEGLLIADLDRRSTHDGVSWRDEAHVLTTLAFRNGVLADLHAGRRSALLEDPSLSRISDAEMSKLMTDVRTKLEALLRTRDRNPAEYSLLLRRTHRDYVSPNTT